MLPAILNIFQFDYFENSTKLSVNQVIYRFKFSISFHSNKLPFFFLRGRRKNDFNGDRESIQLFPHFLINCIFNNILGFRGSTR